MNNIKKILEESYRELRSINPKIKLKFSETEEADGPPVPTFVLD